MFKIKKKTPSSRKQPALYNIIEDYSEFDPPGNVTVCAMTETEDRDAHARILAESYQIPIEIMVHLLTVGGVYIYPQAGLLVTQGLFACEIDPSGVAPKQTWVLDVQQYAEAEQAFAKISDNPEASDFSMRAIYWRMFCAQQLKNSKL